MINVDEAGDIAGVVEVPTPIRRHPPIVSHCAAEFIFCVQRPDTLPTLAKSTIVFIGKPGIAALPIGSEVNPKISSPGTSGTALSVVEFPIVVGTVSLPGPSANARGYPYDGNESEYNRTAHFYSWVTN